MKTNNTKIKITKDKIIKEENQINENEYDFTGEFKAMGQALVDSAKMTYQTLKRMFFSTVFGIKTLNALRNKDMKRLEKLREDFLRDDQNLKQEQDRLITAQPGIKDLQLFLGMTSPGAVLFDKYLSADKASFWKKAKNLVIGDENEKLNDLRSKAAYHNLIMILGEIIFPKTSITLNTYRDISANKSIRKAPKELLSKTSNTEFKQIVAYLGTFFYNIQTSDKLYFSIGEDLYKVLYMIHEGKSGDSTFSEGVIDVIRNKNLSHEIESLVTKLSNVTTRSKLKAAAERFEYNNNMPDPKSAKSNRNEEELKKAREEETKRQEEESEKSNTEENRKITIKGGRILSESELIEEGFFDFWKGTKSVDGEEPIKKAQQALEEKDIDAKDLAVNCFSLYYCAKAFLYTMQLHSIFKKNSIFLEYKVENLKDFNEFKTIRKETTSKLEKDTSAVIDNINKINNIVPLYNNEFDQKSNKINLDKMETIKKDFVKGTDKVNQNYEKLAADSNELEKKKLCYSMILTILESEDFKSITSNKITGTAQGAFETYEKNIDFYIENIKEIDDQKLAKIRKKINIPPASTCMVEISNMRKEIKSLLETITKSEQTFSNFLSEESNIKEKYDKIEKEISEMSVNNEETDEELENSGDLSSAVISKIDGPNTQSFIVSPDILNKQRGENK